MTFVAVAGRKRSRALVGKVLDLKAAATMSHRRTASLGSEITIRSCDRRIHSIRKTI